MIRYLLSSALGVSEIILIVACALIVVGAIVTAIIRKLKGKPSCGGDCGCCSNCPDVSNDTINKQK